MVLQHAERGTVTTFSDDVPQNGLNDFLDSTGLEKGGPERNDLRTQHEIAAVRPDIAQLLQRPQTAARGRRTEAGAHGDFTEGLLGMIAVKRMDHRQPSRQRSDELAILCQTCAPRAFAAILLCADRLDNVDL